MRVLHVLATGGMGWSGGIRPTLRSLAESPLGQHHEFAVAGLSELAASLHDWNPELLVWHGACSWKALPRLLAHRGRRQILFEHHYCAGFEHHNVPSPLRFRSMLRLCYGTMEQVVAVSRAQRRWMGEARLLPASRGRLLLSSRTLEDFLDLPPPTPAAGRTFTLLAYGRLTAQKGFDRLIRALQVLPGRNLRLLLAGDGPQRLELEGLAGSDERIELLGARNDIPTLLGQADAVVVPSRWEPWGNVCLEARAAGRPVVVSGVDGLPEQVAGNGEACGLVVNGGSEQALAAALDALHSATDRQRREWSEAGRRSSLTAWDDYLEGWNRLLEAAE